MGQTLIQAYTNYRKPRINYKQHEELGGMDRQFLLEYYYAARLRSLVCWCNRAYFARWKELQLAMTAWAPFQATETSQPSLG